MEKLPSPCCTDAPLPSNVAHSILVEAAFQLCNQIEASSTEQGGVLDSLLLALYSLFQQQLLLQALDLVDQDRVTNYTLPKENKDTSSQVCWEKLVCMVKGSTNKEYTCCISTSTNHLHCSCPSFRFSVAMRKETVMCKHLLAACLAVALHRGKSVIVTKLRWEELWESSHTQ